MIICRKKGKNSENVIVCSVLFQLLKHVLWCVELYLLPETGLTCRVQYIPVAFTEVIILTHKHQANQRLYPTDTPGRYDQAMVIVAYSALMSCISAAFSALLLLRKVDDNKKIYRYRLVALHCKSFPCRLREQFVDFSRGHKRPAVLSLPPYPDLLFCVGEIDRKHQLKCALEVCAFQNKA